MREAKVWIFVEECDKSRNHFAKIGDAFLADTFVGRNAQRKALAMASDLACLTAGESAGYSGLLLAAKCALADLEGIMPEHELFCGVNCPARRTIKELKAAIRKASR